MFDEASQVLVLEVLTRVQVHEVALDLVDHAQAVVDLALGTHVKFLGLLILVVFLGERLNIGLINLLEMFEFGLVPHVLLHRLLQFSLHISFVLFDGTRSLQLYALALFTAGLRAATLILSSFAARRQDALRRARLG